MNINNLGLDELSLTEKKKVNGGWVQGVAQWFFAGLLWDLVTNPSYCSSQFNAGWNSYRY